MSFDFRLLNFCDHKVFKEKLSLEKDGLTIVVPRKISSKSTTKLFVDGTESKPSDPVFGHDVNLKETYKEFTTTGSSIFRLLVDREITLPTESIDISTITFYQNSDRTKEIASTSFDISISGDYTEITTNDTLGSSLVGKFCFVTFEYSVFNKESTGTALHEIIFNRFLPNQDSHVFEVSYVTTVENCRKCGGFGYLNDIKIDSTGGIERVENNEKLIQDVRVYTLTEKDSDPFYSFVGTKIVSVVGNPYVRNFTETEIARTTRDALEGLQDLQDVQKTVQDVTDQEKLLEIKSISLIRRANDETFFDLDIKVLSELNEELELDTLLKFSRVV
jgi:hypothetical protein